MQGATLMGSTTPVCFQAQQNTCTVNNGVVTFTCPGPGPGFQNYTPCTISSSCSPMYPSPAFCYFGQQYINPGQVVTVNVNQVSGQSTFNFGSIGTSGFVSMVAVGVAVAALSGLTILGSGLNQASIQIMFVSGLLLGLWWFLANVDGFINDNPASFFVQVDKASIGAGQLPFGTIAYLILTLIECLGIISFTSWGGEG